MHRSTGALMSRRTTSGLSISTIRTILAAIPDGHGRIYELADMLSAIPRMTTLRMVLNRRILLSDIQAVEAAIAGYIIRHSRISK